MNAELAERVQQAFDRCKMFPEAGARDGIFQVRGDAYLALIDLRNMCPEIVLALSKAESQKPVQQRRAPMSELPADQSRGGK